MNSVSPRMLLFRAVLWFAIASFLFLVPRSSGQAGITPEEQQLFDLVNQERQRAGLQKLKWDYHLAEAARAHTELQVQQRTLSHDFPGEPPLDQRIADRGARFSTVGENVAFAPTIPDMHHNLMNSPPHRANILNGNFNAIGIAVVERDGELYGTQDFGHLLPVYSEDQFRDAVIAEFNQTRTGQKIPPIDARPDPRMKAAACSNSLDVDKLLHSFPGATDLAVFTASQPQELPASMQKAAVDRTLRRMNIGVCFAPQSKAGFSKFWVVAAFYPVD